MEEGGVGISTQQRGLVGRGRNESVETYPPGRILILLPGLESKGFNLSTLAGPLKCNGLQSPSSPISWAYDHAGWE